MRFFVPLINDEGKAQAAWNATKQFAEDTLKWSVSNRRIFSIAHTHIGMNCSVQVGKPHNETGQVVLIILESNAFLVCTRDHGYLRDMPILIGKEEAHRVTDFEE